MEHLATDWLIAGKAPYSMSNFRDGSNSWINAGAFGHPAFLNEAHFQNIKSKFDDSLGMMVCNTHEYMNRAAPAFLQRYAYSRCV